MLVIKAGPGLQVGNGASQSIDSLNVQAGPRSGDVFFYTKTIDLCTTPGQTDCQPEAYVSRDYSGKLTLPIQLLLTPGSHGLDEEIHVWVDGYKSTGEHQLSSGVHFMFSKGERLWIELPLFGECVGDLSCEPTDTACVATGTDRNCVDIMPTRYEPDMATIGDAGSTTTDGGTSPDGMMSVPDQGIDQGVSDLSGTVGDMHAEAGVDLSKSDFAGCTPLGPRPQPLQSMRYGDELPEPFMLNCPQ